MLLKTEFERKVKISLYKKDILMVSSSSNNKSEMSETVLISIIAIIATDTKSFSLVRKVVETYFGVSTWRLNRIEKFKRQKYDIPTERIFTFNYLIVKESIRSTRTIPKLMLKNVYQNLLNKRSKVIDQLESGFHTTILKKAKLKHFFLNRALIEEARQEVPLHLDYIQPITKLDRVSRKNIPKLPTQNMSVNIPIGTFFINSHKVVGLANLSKLIIFGGSRQKTLVGSLQHFIRTIHNSKRKIIILDIGNELGGLAEGLKQTNDKKLSIKIHRIGQNLNLNICHTDNPNHITDEAKCISIKANIISSILAFASESSNSILANLSQLKLKMVEALKKIPPAEISLLNISRSDIFTHHLSQVDPLTLEQLSAEIKYYADYSELNSLDFQENSLFLSDGKFSLDPGVSLFQFLGQNLRVRKVIFTFLLHKLANRCDKDTIIIIPDATQILRGGNDLNNWDIFEEAIGHSYRRIVQLGCMVLATYSIMDLHPMVLRDIRTGIFFKFLSVNDREWIRANYALDRSIENVEGFLQGIDDEALLFRSDDPHSIYYFVPEILEPVKDVPLPHDRTHSTLLYHDMSNAQFSLLMPILELIRNTPLQELALLDILHEKGIKNLSRDWEALQASPYIISVESNDPGSECRISISLEGEKLFDTIHRKCQQLPQPFDSSAMRDITFTLNNLRKRAIDTPEEYNQVKIDIHEIAGSLLSQYFELKGSIDWYYFKTYLSLHEIQGYGNKSHVRRINIIESFYSKILSEKQAKSNQLDIEGD